MKCLILRWIILKKNSYDKLWNNDVNKIKTVVVTSSCPGRPISIGVYKNSIAWFIFRIALSKTNFGPLTVNRCAGSFFASYSLIFYSMGMGLKTVLTPFIVLKFSPQVLICFFNDFHANLKQIILLSHPFSKIRYLWH